MVTQPRQATRSSRHDAPRFRTSLRPLAAALMVALCNNAFALPTDPTIVSGQAAVNAAGTTGLVVNQSSSKAAIDWRTFSVGSNETVRFNQPSTAAVTVNRVTTNDPSQILGKISALGSVFLINPSGIIFGRDAVIDVGSLVASTLTASSADLLSGRYVFGVAPGGSGSVRNEGRITAAEGGSVTLIGTRVSNTGTIVTPGGSTGLIAGERVNIDFDGDGLVRYQVDAGAAPTLVENAGQIIADGGRVALQAGTRDALLDTVLNVDGVVRARSISRRNGEIYLDGGGSGVVQVSGTLDASGTAAGVGGGRVRVLGESVGLFGRAHIDASGETGGGTVLIGGNYQGGGAEHNATRSYVGSGASISADATGSGDGGKVIVWADDWTRFYGSIRARGGALGGDGGFVEVSGKRNLAFSGDVNTGAVLGRAGMLLLDPENLNVVSGEAPAPAVTADPAGVFRAPSVGDDITYYVSASSLDGASDYTLQAPGTVTFATSVAFNGVASNIISVTGGTGIIFAGGSTVSTKGAALSLTAPDMTLGAITTNVGSPAGGNLKIDASGTVTQLAAFTLGAGSLIKQGTGTLNLSQTNTYTGSTTVNAGTITVSNAAGLGFSAVQVDSGATLYIDGVTIAPSSINIAGSGVDGTGALTGTGAASYSGSLVLSGAAAVGATAGSTLTLGAINGGVGDSLIKLGDGTVVLGGPASYSGGTTIGAGVLTAGNATALGPAGTVTVTSGGTLNIADGITLAAGTPISLSGTLRGTGNAVYDGTVTLAAATARIDTPIASDTLTLRAAMDGSSALTKIGAGTLKLSGANSYSGSTAINGGTVLLNSSSTLPDLTVVSFSGAGSKLELNGTNQHIGSLGGSGTIQLGTGTLRVTQNVDNTFSGTIAGAGNLTKDGPATLTLTSAGGYAGTTRVTGGMLTLQGAGSLGGGAATVDNGATLHLDGVSLTSPSSINLAGAGWNDGTHSYGALWGTGAAGYTGELALTSPATIHVGPFSGASTDRLTLTAGSGGTVISGGISRNLTKTGLGTLEISTGSASFGDMAIQAGTLSIRSDALGVGDVSVASGATLNINNTALHTPRSIQLSGNGLGGAGALTGTGTAGYTGAIALPAATSIGVSAGSMFTLNTNRSGAGNLTKVGAGTLVLGGSAATHSGTTTIAAGILTAASNSAFGPGSVAVDSGATLNIADGITLAAGTPISLSGTLRGTGNAVYDGTVTLAAATARIDTPIASDTLTLRAAMDGSSALTKIGAGTLKLSGANSYSGSTAINGGTVLLNSSSTLPDLTVVSFSGAGSKLELNGTNQHIGSLGGSGTIQLGTGTLRVTQNVDNTFSGTIAGAGNLTKDGPATLTLTSAGGYAGTTRVTGGMLTLQGAGSLGGGAATVDNGATLHLDGVSLTSPSSINLAGAGWNDGTHSYGALWGTGAAGYTGELALTSPATIHVGPFSGASTDRLTLTAGSGGTVISGGISRNLTKTGLGTLEISTGSASFGDTAIQAGTLSVRSDALGVGDVSVASGATLNINNTALHTPRSIQLSGNGLGGAGALTGTGTAGYTGAIALPAATSIGVSAGSILTLNANRSGAGNLTKVGGGTLVLGGSAATHSGTTTIAAGILTAVSNSAFGPGSVAVDSGATLNIADGVTLGSPSSINLAGSGVVIAGRSVGALMGTGAASYSGGVRLASDAEITAAAGGTLTLNGTVNGATRALTIDGPGTVTLAAGANGLSSVTQLAGSTLNLGASQSIVTSGVQTYLGTLRGANATLRSTGGGAVSAAGSANHFTGTLTLDTTGPASLAGHFGSLNAHTGALSLGATTVDSNAAIIASGTIGQTAALVVGGTTTLDAGANAITLGNAGNDFGGAVSATGGTATLRDANALDVALHTGATTLDAASLSASGTASSLLATTTGALTSRVGTAGDATYHAGGALVFGTSSIGGNLNATAAGPVSQTGALAVTGTATVDADSQAVTLAEANRIGGLFSVTTTGPASLAGHFGSLNAHTGALSLGATTVDSNAAIIASGTIGQTAALVVGGTTTLDAGANAITLGNAGNDFGGAVSATGGTATLRDANALDVALHTGATTLDAASLSASGTASSLLATTTGALTSRVGTAGDATYHAGGALVFGTSSIGGNLNATAAGPVSQTGALAVTGTATVDADSQAVTLAGHFGSLNAHTGALSLGATTVDSNAAIIASGTIGQTAALVVGGTTTLDAGANAITLGNAGNDFGGAVSATGGTATLRDANALDVALHTGATTLDAASLSASGTASSLLATTTGALTSRVGTAGDATYHAGGALVFGTSSIGGNLNATAAGPVSQTGALAVTGTATVDAGSQAVTLAEANRIGGLFSVTTTGPASLAGHFGSLNAHTGALSLGATTVDSNAAIIASGTIGQTAALVVGGTTTLDAGANAITLGNAGNDFGGAVSATGGTATLRDANALDVALHTGATTLDAASLSASGTASSLLATTTGALTSRVGTAGDATYHAGGALVFGTSSIGGNLNATAAGPVSQTGALAVTGTATVDAGSNGIDLSTGANLFRAPLVVTGGTTVIASDHGKLAVTLETGDTQLFADEIEVSGSMALTNTTSRIRSPNAIPLGNLSITGSGSLEIISDAVMGSSAVSNVSVQNAIGVPNKLTIYGASIYQQAGARILTGPSVTLLLNATGKGSIDLSADASVAMSDPSRSTTRLGDLLSVFSKATGANRTVTHDGTNQIQGGISAITKADERQGTNQPKTIVAIASDTITVAPGSIDPVTSVRKPSIDADSVMLIARAINGGGGKIQTHVAATAFGDGRNIATGPTRAEDKDYVILPSIFVISEPNTSGYSFGTLDVPISVSFGAVAGQTSNSLLQTIAVDPFNKEGSSGQVPVYLGTNLQPGEDAVGPIKRYLVFPIDIPKNAIRAVVVNGVKIEDSSAYDAVQTAVAEILNQVRKEQLESGFSNENVAAQLRKGVITETRVGQAAVDRFQGVAPSQRCVGMMVGEMVVCAPAAGPAR